MALITSNPEQNQPQKVILRVKAGDTVTVQFVDDRMSDQFVTTYTHFYNGRSYECAGEDCELCKQGVRKTRRHFAEVYNLDEGINQILEIPATLGVQLQGLFDSLEEENIASNEVPIKIKRIGSGLSGYWNTLPVKDKKVKPKKKFDVLSEYKRFIKTYQTQQSKGEDDLDGFSFE